eukprot:TRINITY_DN1409_c0_g3_i1.p1 TRINITY_DN1409_c0_g3~~TRINITY_DN1409_c0_g3_i1.p1  ORF type:complete len:425 (-),score=103.29 TRINITY_DN1409_c0_g3_i1:457-1731(-)
MGNAQPKQPFSRNTHPIDAESSLETNFLKQLKHTDVKPSSHAAGSNYYEMNLDRWNAQLPGTQQTDIALSTKQAILDLYDDFPHQSICTKPEHFLRDRKWLQSQGTRIYDMINNSFGCGNHEFLRVISLLTFDDYGKIPDKIGTPQSLESGSYASSGLADSSQSGGFSRKKRDGALILTNDEKIRFQDIIPYSYNHIRKMGSWISPSVGAIQWPLPENIADLYECLQLEHVSSIISLGPTVDTAYWDPYSMKSFLPSSNIRFYRLDRPADAHPLEKGFLETEQSASPTFGHHSIHPSLRFGCVEIGDAHKVRLYRYEDWEDYEAPSGDALDAVITLASLIRQSKSQHKLLVHCRAGVGRTGTLMLIANCWEEWEANGQVDVLFELLKLRLRRDHMVQQFSQLLYVYTAMHHITSKKLTLGDYNV